MTFPQKSAVTAGLIIIGIVALGLWLATPQKEYDSAEIDNILHYVGHGEYSDSIITVSIDSTGDSSRARENIPGWKAHAGPSKDTPWVSVIIDDFGPPWPRDVVQGILTLPADVTISIIPGNLHSRKIAALAGRFDKEVFIHLPLEPVDSVAMKERDMIYTGTDSIQLGIILDRVFGELPAAVGLNNHMGSRATADTALMRLLAERLDRRNLVYVDSWTTPESVGLDVMERCSVSALGRDVFLDFTDSLEVVRRQFRKLIGIARHRGWSIGIGHVRETTLQVLSEEIPAGEEMGVRFVFASRLIRTVKDSNRRSYLSLSASTVDRSGIGEKTTQP